MEQKERIKQISIQSSVSIIKALKRMDITYKRLLLVFDKENFKSVLSIGDIQRAIISGVSLDNTINSILRSNVRIAKENDSFESIKALMLHWRAECMPVVDIQNKLIKVFFWEDVFGEKEKRQQSKLNLPVIIMAGGTGTRLKPLTNVIPKPLIPIGEKTIIEEIMDRFVNVGCNDFSLSVNYKAETIKHYFEQLNNSTYHFVFSD